MRCAEELLQGSRPFQIELPHVERLALAGEDLVEKHHLNHISDIVALLYHIFDVLLQHHHFIRRPPVQTLVGP